MRKTIFVLCLVASGPSFALPTTNNFQDWWWNASMNGMGVNIGQQRNTIAAAWYLYNPDGSASFLILPGQLVNNTVSGNLYRSTGPSPSPAYDPNLVTDTPVGTGTLTFTSDSTATLTYSYDGISGTIQLTRFTFATVGISGTWDYAYRTSSTNCSNAYNNGTVVGGGVASFSASANSMSITMQDSSGEDCSYSTSYSQSGSIASGSGTFSCSNGISGTVNFVNLRVSDGFLTADFNRVTTVNETCHDSGKIGAVTDSGNGAGFY